MRREFSSRRERLGREERECPYRGLLPLLPGQGPHSKSLDGDHVRDSSTGQCPDSRASACVPIKQPTSTRSRNGPTT